MSYFLYQLEFDGPVHFGNAELGGALEQIGMEYPSDTLFSAICCELACQQETDLLASFCSKTSAGAILLSDLFPYRMTEKEDCYFYVPRPVIPDAHQYVPQLRFTDACRAFQEEKTREHITYIRAAHITAYMRALEQGDPYDENDWFGISEWVEHGSCRIPGSPSYYTGRFTFAKGCGMYSVIRLEQDDDMEWLQHVIALLGYSGIGGERSSGCGKFHLADDPFVMDQDGIYEDDAALYQKLLAVQAQWQMNISMLLPSQNAIPVITRGWYTLRKRSGFMNAPDQAAAAKRNSVYMLPAGSCFPERTAGECIVLADNGTHPVYRYGKGLYIGLV